jgi:hypothetical protein
MVPRDAQVAAILCAEFEARWTIKVTGDADQVVRLLGMKVTLAPDVIEVDAVTEDV